MKEFTLRQGLNALNLFLVAVFLVLALYSAIGQQIFPYIGQYRIDIEHYLSSQLDSVVGIRTLDGDMNILTPSIHLEGITLASENSPSDPSLSIAAVDAVLDPRASLINLTPVFKSVRLSGLSIRIDAASRPEVDNDADPDLVQRFIESLLLQQHLELNNVTVELKQKRKTKLIRLDNLVMTGDGFNRLMSGSLSYGDEDKVKAGIRLFSQGSPYNLDDFYARGVLDLPQLDVDYWLEELVDVSAFNSFKASAQMSVEFKNGLLNYAKLNLASPDVSLSNDLEFSRVNSEIWLKQGDQDSWTLWLKDAKFGLANMDWHFSDLATKLTKTPTGNRWQAYATELDLPYIRNFTSVMKLLPPEVAGIIDKLNPRGSIRQGSLIVQQDVEAAPTVTFAGKLSGVSIDANDGTPAVSNVHGVVAATKYGGRVQFASSDIKLAFPDLYDRPFEFLNGSGQVDWFIKDHEVQILGNGLNFKHEWIENIKGGFDLTLNNNELLDDTIELNLSMTNANVIAQSLLVPRVVNSDLKSWLNSSLLKGSVSSGSFYLYSSLSEKNSESQLELFLSPKNAVLSYLPEWPAIEALSGKLFVENERVLAFIDSGKSLGGVFNSGELLYEDDLLWVAADVNGSSDEVLQYFKTTPLKSIAGDVVKEWSLNGVHNTDLNLYIPFTNEEVIADIGAVINESNLNMTDLDLTFEHLNGKLEYKTSSGLFSKSVTGELWGSKIQSSINSYNDGLLTDISFSGSMSSIGLKSWLDLDLLKPISGETLVNGHFLIDARDNGFTGLKLTSNLEGVKIDLPSPFQLKENETSSFDMSLKIEDSLIFKMNYGEKVNLALESTNGVVRSGQVYLGKTEAYVPTGEGVVVQGHLEELNINKWLNVWDRISTDETSKSGDNPLSDIQLSTDRLVYDDFQFEHVKVKISNQNPRWLFDIDAPIAKGDVIVEKDMPIKLDLNYIHWPMIVEDDVDQNSKELDPLLEVYPESLPNIDLKVSEIFVGPTNYGRWSLKTDSDELGLRVSEIDGEIKKLAVKGDVVWQKSKRPDIQQFTLLDLDLSSSDVGGIQAAWKIKPAVEAESGNANINFKWNASPTDFKMESLNGDFGLNLKDGRFIEAGEAGALGAFGILNFGAIGRRLRLDFTDVYQSGVHFDSVKGRGIIKDGVLTVTDTFDVDGPAAKFAMSGQVNMLTKELNQELSVTFPISSTLPFVAILAGFAPPVAASLFVGERLVGDEIEKFTSATYELTGSWDEPKLKLKKRFDNEIEGKKDKSFWHRMKDIFGIGGD